MKSKDQKSFPSARGVATDKLASAILAGMKAREAKLLVLAEGAVEIAELEGGRGDEFMTNAVLCARIITALAGGFVAEREAFEQAMGEE